MIMTEEKTVKIRDLVRTLDLEALDITWSYAVETATLYALQLGYPVAAGTNGAYADHEVTGEHAAIIADLIVHTDADGVYTGGLGTE